MIIDVTTSPTAIMLESIPASELISVWAKTGIGIVSIPDRSTRADFLL
ncbi:hypothetical protein [Marivirga harenae]|nr:hypothetical protein [Marivirga harenae]WKV11832.1 hypothetical protein Q3Y49_16645 [Marivirga harenae]